jgi:endo-1,4-beta-D-glucanase Y
MLATALMGDQAEFDGLYAYFLDHPSANDAGLMAWAQDASCNDVDGPDSATDGDLDIAYALLLDGNAGASTVIASIRASEIGAGNQILVGDWAGPDDSHYTGTRPSDFMPGHFRAFGWDDVLDKTYASIAALQSGFAPDTGLLPDFAIDADTDAPSPAPGGWLEGPDDGHFSYNACRTPWRIALDSGDPRARAAVQKVEAWAKQTTGGDVAQLVNGYALDGTPIGDGPDLAFLAPMAAGSIVTDDQAWVDASWDALVAAGPSGSYYGDSLRLLAMIAMTGHWRTP